MIVFTAFYGCFLIVGVLLAFLVESKRTNKLLQRDRDFWYQEFKKESTRNHETLLHLLGEDEFEFEPTLTLVRGGLDEED